MESFCIGFSGQKQVGKDTSAGIIIPMLKDKLDKTFSRVAFADAVKNMLCCFYYKDDAGETKKVTREWIEEKKEEKAYIPKSWNMSVREGLTNIGDRFREICPSVWIDIAMSSSSVKNKIFTDIRYKNEAKLVYEYDKGLIIRVMRPGFRVTEGNRSETDLNEYDNMLPNIEYEGPINVPEVPYHFILQNDGTVTHLEDKIHNKLIPFILNRWKYFIS